MFAVRTRFERASPAQQRGIVFINVGLLPITVLACAFRHLTMLLLILLPLYIEANLLIFKYEFFKGTGYCNFYKHL